MENHTVFEHYRKIARVFDHNLWKWNFHLTVPIQDLKWLYQRVIINLALNQDLPTHIRYIKEDDFIFQMKEWLKIAYEHKRKNPFSKSYFFKTTKSTKFNFLSYVLRFGEYELHGEITRDPRVWNFLADVATHQLVMCLLPSSSIAESFGHQYQLLNTKYQS